MKKCARCETENVETAQYCDECGDQLARFSSLNTEIGDANATFVEGAASRKEDVLTAEPVISGASWVREISNTNAFKQNSLKENLRAKLVLERGKSAGKEFVINSDETTIGRWDADNGIFPDVDLDPDDPEAKVSRRHARIIREDLTFLLEDLGSTNGTFINRGRRLPHGNRQPLEDGDEIIVGKTFLRFRIIR